MRKVIFFLIIILFLPTTSWAADPIIGTWKLNISKSKYPLNREPPKELTETYREIEGGLIDFTYDVIQADGSKMLFKGTWPVEGGVLTAPEGQLPEGRSYVETLLEPGNWWVTVLQDGKQMGGIHKVVSKDGQTLMQTTIGIDHEGFFEMIQVYEKQADNLKNEKQIITQEQAAKHAAKLANEKCQEAFGESPFKPESYKAELVDLKWHWGKIEPFGIHGYSAKVEFYKDGSGKNVEVAFSTDALDNSYKIQKNEKPIEKIEIEKIEIEQPKLPKK